MDNSGNNVVFSEGFSIEIVCCTEEARYLYQRFILEKLGGSGTETVLHHNTVFADFAADFLDPILDERSVTYRWSFYVKVVT